MSHAVPLPKRLALTGVFLSLTCAGLAGSPAWAGASVVSANPHRLTCGSTTPPQSGIVSYSGVEAVSYHVDVVPDPVTTCSEVNTALAFASNSKPKIISDDIKEFSAAQVNPRIDDVATAGEHFEHFSRPMDQKLVDGETIDDSNDFDSESKMILAKLGSKASKLTPHGTLTQVGTEFYWNGQQITLMGFSVNAILATKNVDLAKYLDVLAGYNVNFLRVDGISQWAALEIGTPPINPANGLNPFAIVSAGGSGTVPTWNLNAFNQEYFNRAKDLVQLAADRGIVVQFSIFDRHGLLNEPNATDAYGRFLGSPYNTANNNNGLLAAGPVGKAPSNFTGVDGTTIGGINKAYMQKLVKEIGAYGNVMFEVMNEPLESAADWTNTVAWHQWVADTVNTELNSALVTMPLPKSQAVVTGSTASFVVMASGFISPAYQWQKLVSGSYVSLVDGGNISGAQTPTLKISSASSTDAATYRCLVSGTGVAAINSGPATLSVITGGLVVKDGFNTGEGTLLQGRATETGSKTWSADDVKISGQKARSNNETGKTRILGSVPVSLTGLQTASVQADVRQTATGYASVGFRSSALSAFENIDGSLWLDMTRAGSLSLKKRSAGVVATLLTVDLTTVGFTLDSTVNLRLVYKVAAGKADVYVNSVKRMNDVPLGFTPSTAYAGFQGRRGVATDTYLDTHGEFDNFEAVLSPQ